MSGCAASLENASTRRRAATRPAAPGLQRNRAAIFGLRFSFNMLIIFATGFQHDTIVADYGPYGTVSCYFA